MTLVTTSRRSTPVTRSIAKDLAFATGAMYLSRGKHGLREISDEHDLFIVIEQQQPGILMTLYQEGQPYLMRSITTHETGIREGVLFRGIRTSDQDLARLLDGTCPIEHLDGPDLMLAFDGPQRRVTTLMLGRVLDDA